MAFFFPPVVAAMPVQTQVLAQAGFTLPGEAVRPELSMEKATRDFGEAIQALSPADRSQIQDIHAGVDDWAVGRRDADKMGQFLVRVMIFADQRLSARTANPGSAEPGECQGLERVFVSGFQLVEVYSKLRRR